MSTDLPTLDQLKESSVRQIKLAAHLQDMIDARHQAEKAAGALLIAALEALISGAIGGVPSPTSAGHGLKAGIDLAHAAIDLAARGAGT